MSKRKSTGRRPNNNKRDPKSDHRSERTSAKSPKIANQNRPEKTQPLHPVHEKFARLVAEGTSHIQAAVSCGRSPGSASYIFSRPEVKKRIDELRAIQRKAIEAEVEREARLKAGTSNEVTKEHALEFLDSVVGDKTEQTANRIRASCEVIKARRQTPLIGLKAHGWSEDEIDTLLKQGVAPARHAQNLTDQRHRTEFIEQATSCTYEWMTKFTRTRNDHWREEGKEKPLEPLPSYDYLRDLCDGLEFEKVIWIEKSRDLMISWTCVGFFTLNAMIVPARGVIFQTQKQDKVVQLIEYAKCLYEHQDPRLKEAFPLAKPLDQQPATRLEFKNGSSIVGIPGGANQIRSYHPWGYFNDESSFQADAGSCYNEAISAVSGPIVFNSSAGPGWYADVRRDIFNSEQDSIPVQDQVEVSSFSRNSPATAALLETRKLPPQSSVRVRRGVEFRRTKSAILVLRFHYSCHQERDPERNPDWFARERRKYTSQADWDREQEIMDDAGGGELVFAECLRDFWDKIVIDDPKWDPDPEWTVVGGFDHGKTNPTALLRAYIDYEGNIYFAGEYYQPGLEVWQHAPEIKRMRDFSRMETIYADPSIFHSTHQQQQRLGHAAERAKSIADLYEDLGINNLIPSTGDISDVSFAARLQLHWSNLEEWLPTVRVVCRNFSERPQYGLHQWDCPNLLWELMRARRVKLGDQQLLNRNISEGIVDKDNHARDAMKYIVMSCPEPTPKSLERRVNERLIAVARVDPTKAAIQYSTIIREEREAEEFAPSFYGGNARRRIKQALRRGWRRR